MSLSNDFTKEPVTPTGGDGLFARIRLDIAYDGTSFSGWAMQPGLRTVAAVLSEALRIILRTDVRLTVAGRTDAGVHAIGQVAHFDISEQRWQAYSSRIGRSLAGLLPRDVRVHSVRRVPRDFDARYSGLFRQYRYRISDAAWGVSPLQRNDVAHWPRRLDLARVRRASVPLVGLHDFAAFCRRRAGASTIRNVQRLDWSQSGGILEATVQADAFCHSMVRSVVGALLAAGDGSMPVSWPASLLSQTTRNDRVAVATAGGLTLVTVAYPPDDQLASRNSITRNTRQKL